LYQKWNNFAQAKVYKKKERKKEREGWKERKKEGKKLKHLESVTSQRKE